MIRAGLVVFAILCALVAWLAWPHPAPNYLVPGDQWLGEPLPDAPAVRAALPITLVGGCTWGRPGSNPWRGDDFSALRAMSVPEDQAGRLAQRMRAKQYDAVIYRSNLGTWTSHHVREFGPASAMTFGADRLCMGSITNFRTDAQIERGVLYSEDGVDVAVWDACGNLDRLIPVDRGGVEVVPLPGAGGLYGAPGVGVPPALANRLARPLVRLRPPIVGLPIPVQPDSDTDIVPGGETRPVDEPETLALLLVGAAIVITMQRRKP